MAENGDGTSHAAGFAVRTQTRQLRRATPSRSDSIAGGKAFSKLKAPAAPVVVYGQYPFADSLALRRYHLSVMGSTLVRRSRSSGDNLEQRRIPSPDACAPKEVLV